MQLAAAAAAAVAAKASVAAARATPAAYLVQSYQEHILFYRHRFC
jgi:hypothetical protein